jgi:hypothetical protein
MVHPLNRELPSHTERMKVFSLPQYGVVSSFSLSNEISKAQKRVCSFVQGAKGIRTYISLD